MEIGRCTRCGRPFTAGEVAGLGILRTRPAREGGPRMEFTCPRCDTVLHLVPHGHGRYAPPGAPPPPPVPPGDRAPPWALRPDRPSSPPPPGGADPPATEPIEIPLPPPAPRPPPRPSRPNVAPRVTPQEARSILGVGETAKPEEIERAFRERSLTCHPDKVAHLDPEFQELAEHKFRRLREAYDLLRS